MRAAEVEKEAGSASLLERRLFRIGYCLIAAGTAAIWVFFDLRAGLSFAAGGLLAAANLAWLRRTASAVMFENQKRSKRSVLTGYFFRLVLIPLTLYAMIRFLFLSVPAVVAGFAAFHFSVLIEGILEAFRSKSG